MAKIEVNKLCPECKKYHSVTVESRDYLDFKNGKCAQDCFPYLTDSQREILIIGICEECWNKIFK